MNDDFLARLAAINGSVVDASQKESTARCMFYGPSGTGKSTLAAMVMRSIVKPDRLIVQVDTSEGYVSWRNHPGLSDGIKVIPFTTLEDLRVIAKAIKDKVAPWDKVDGIILDEASKMTEQDVPRVYEARLKGLYGPKEKELAEDQAGQAGRDYMIALERYRKMIYELFDNRNVHIILLAHEKEKVNKQGAVINITPDFTPKIAKATKEYLHLSARLSTSINKDPNDVTRTIYSRIAQVHPSSLVDAKCRMGITETSINADLLPMTIKQWVQDGAIEVTADDKPREEVSDNLKGIETEGKTTSEILDQIDDELDTSSLFTSITD